MAKKKTKKVLVARSENVRAQRLYLIITGLLIWFNAISVLLIIKRAILFVLGKDEMLDPLAEVLITIIFLCFSIGLWAIFKMHPPLHHLIVVGAIFNIIVSYFNGINGYLQGIMSVLLIYFAIRFPINFEYEKRTLN